ncbi:MAG: folylpolyglutamate synthase/dihydrofolate synthase family protein [Mangrovibacterium sp.]
MNKQKKGYSEVLDFLYGQLPMFQRTGAAAYKNTLDNTLALDRMFGHPHRQFKSIHVAGTNGKGSVAHMLASVLQEAGYRVGLYTSPHLVDFRERIRVNGEMISEGEVMRFVEHFLHMNKTRRLEPSFFELTVAMAFDHFKRCRVELAVVEVGLGGRLDSTNIISPELSLITNISVDHTALLGNTVPLIAAEKAGIIKPGVPVVVSETNPESAPVFVRKARETGSPIWFADQHYRAAYVMQTTDGLQVFQFLPSCPDLKTDLLGSYQRYNLAGVLQGLDILRKQNWKVDREAVYRGLQRVRANTGLRGRWEIAGHRPMVVCDTGHNEGGIRQVVEQLQQTPRKRLHVVFGMVSDKEVGKVLRLLPSDAVYYFTRAAIPRALDPVMLQQMARKAGLQGTTYPDVKKAVAEALRRADPADLVFVGGSSFVVADFLTFCNETAAL